jgi:hypothetical protein
MEVAFAFLVGMLLPVLLALILLIFAARLVTRVVLDELRKDRERRGPI